MIRSPRAFCSLLLIILLVALTACELPRDEADIAEPGPVSELPPTLAPLNAETDLVNEATPVPTVINVQPTATTSNLAEGETASSVQEPTEPTSIPIDLSESSEVSVETAEQASSEEFSAPAEQAAAGNSDVEEAIVVDATTSDELPVGGPVAANPPASQTTGSYDDTPSFSGSNYIVQPGDTLFSIAQRYGTTVDALIYANGLVNDVIRVGQELSIDGSGYAAPSNQQPTYQQPGYQQQPTYQQPGYQQPYVPSGGENYHIVAPGETLFRIAVQYATTVDALAGTNGIPYPYIIQAGQQLIIPPPGAFMAPPAPADDYYQQPPQGYAPPQPQPGYAPQPSADSYGTPQDDYYAPEDNYYAPPDNAYANPSGVGGTHTIAPGETLFSIAQAYGTTADTLAAANGLSNPNQIFVGQVLFLP